MALTEGKFSALLFGLTHVLRLMARRHEHFKRRLGEKNLVAQMRTADGAVARHFTFCNGQVRSARGCHHAPDMTITIMQRPTAGNIFLVAYLMTHTGRMDL